MQVNKDRTVSIVILLVTIIMIIWWIVSISTDSDGLISLTDISLKDIVFWANNNMDLLIIIYIFLCLQAAGLSEFKQGQDYLVVALISIIFTPIGLLFIKNEKENESE